MAGKHPSCDHPGALFFQPVKEGEEPHGYVALDGADRVVAWARNKRDLIKESGERMGPFLASRTLTIHPMKFDVDMQAGQPWLLAFGDVQDDIPDPPKQEEAQEPPPHPSWAPDTPPSDKWLVDGACPECHSDVEDMSTGEALNLRCKSACGWWWLD